MEHEQPVHSEINFDDHLETARALEGVASPDEPEDHAWVGGMELREQVVAELARHPHDAFAYTADALERGDLFEIHAPDAPIHVIYRAGRYEPAILEVEDGAGDCFAEPYARVLEPVAVRPCDDHDGSPDESSLREFFDDLSPMYLDIALLEGGREVSEEVLDDAPVGN